MSAVSTRRDSPQFPDNQISDVEIFPIRLTKSSSVQVVYRVDLVARVALAARDVLNSLPADYFWQIPPPQQLYPLLKTNIKYSLKLQLQQFIIKNKLKLF